MATSNSSWMPVNGRHSVNIGSSLGRALKARKGASAPKRSNLPDRDFYSFRYNFKPESIDTSKPGSIEVKNSKDFTGVTVERSSSQSGESHIFSGTEQPAKEWDCVLIYDEETGTLSLEKLDSYMILQYSRRAATTTINQPSPPYIPPSKTETPKALADNIDIVTELERDLGLDDAEGDIDDEFEQIVSSITGQKQEEEEGEVTAPPRRVPSPLPPPPPPPAKSKPVPRPVKSATKAEAAPPKSKPKASQTKAKGKKREAAPNMDSDPEVEDLQFGRPAQQTKRARASPPAEGLAFPGSSNADPLAHTALYKPPPAPRDIIRVPSPPPASLPSESEEEWDEVPSVLPPSTSQPMEVDAEASDEEEIDVNAFEAEMNEQLEDSDEDFLAAVVSPEPPEIPPSGRPISLNQFAGGEPDDDDYSSSEDSDDD